jgi:hypothetical protein
MKKLASYFIGIAIALIFFSACKATKGCGLTSDAQKIEQQTTQTLVVAEVS